MLLALLLSVQDVRITAPTAAQARALSREALSISNVTGTVVEAVAPETTIDALRARGFVVETPARAGAYPTPEAIDGALDAIAKQYALKVETLGYSVQGHPIRGVRVGSADKPGVRIMGCHHGDEPPSCEMPLRVLEAIAANPPTNAHVLIVPMVNPDGLRARTRTNARGVDINRNYGFEWRRDEYAAGPAPYSEPETRAIALDNEYHRYPLSLTYHSGAENIGYPYNYVVGPMASDALLASYARHYAEKVGALEVLRGADWYVSYGDSNDYSFGYFGGADFTVEIANDKAPPQESLAAIWAKHLPAALDFITVAQGVTPLPLNGPAFVQTASIRVATHPSSHVAWLIEPVLSVTYPGYVYADGMLVPTATSERARTLIAPSATASFARRFSALRAIKMGSDDIAFDCSSDPCVADVSGARPGFYDLVATIEGEEGTVPNALLVGAQPGDAVRVEGGVLFTEEDAWLVERGGGVRLFQAGQLALPSDTSNTLDVLWLKDGTLFVQTVANAETDPNLLPPATSSRRQGCQTVPVEIAWLVGVVCLRRWTRSRTTT